jgi:hypothetical protein
MNTNQTPFTFDIHSLINLYFLPGTPLHTVADCLGCSVLTLADIIERTDVQVAIARVRRMFDDRAPHIASATLERSLTKLDAIAIVPTGTPTPAEQDRLRRTVDSQRRVADLMRRFHTPAPTPRASARTNTASPAAPSLTLALAPSTPSTSPSDSAPESHAEAPSFAATADTHGSLHATPPEPASLPPDPQPSPTPESPFASEPAAFNPANPTTPADIEARFVQLEAARQEMLRSFAHLPPTDSAAA